MSNRTASPANQVAFAEWLQPIPARTLVEALNGDTDPAALIIDSLASRGLDCDSGRWVGFEKAKQIAADAKDRRGIL